MELLKRRTTMINFNKKDPVADTIRGIMEKELVGNQKKLDKNHNGKLDSQDFKILRGQKKATEDVEQIDELSKSTLGSYAKKASRDAVITRKIGADFERKADAARSPGMKAASNEISSRYKQKSFKRRDGLEKAVDRLSKEEVEQIDELKKSTLASYAKKAGDESSYYSFAAGSRSAKDPQRLVSDKLAMKRQSGANKAIDRLSKEDVEAVEENAFDYKSPRQPEPNGGSGVKKGTRYGGSKQKEKPEQEMPKEKNEEYVDEKFGGTQNMLNQTTHKSNDPMRRLKITTDHPRFANKPLNSTSQNILKNRLKSAQGTHSKPNLPEEAFTLKKMKENYEEPILDEMINEVLSKDASAYDYIHDFVHSDNPKFAGKSKAERKKQALAAYYAKKNEEYVEEGMLKNAAKKAFKALTGGSDEDQRKDLQRKMGVPQTGQKPVKEEEQVDEVVHVYRQDADRDRGPLASKHSAPYREVNQKARDKLAGEVKSARKSGAFKVTTHASSTGYSGKNFTQKTAGGSEGSKLHVMGLKNMKANESVVMEGRSPVSSQGMDTPFVTDAENKPLANAKELAAKTMKRMKNEMLGKTGTSE